LDAQDALFHEFGVWQDANGNGLSDEGELLSLAEWGIMSVLLNSDGVMRYLEPGVTEFGRGSVVMQDGSTMLLADAAFEFMTPEAPTITNVPVQAEVESDAEGDADAASADVLTMDMVLPTRIGESPLDLFADQQTATVVQSAPAAQVSETLTTGSLLPDMLLQEETMHH
jgi:hypothetical protein